MKTWRHCGFVVGLVLLPLHAGLPALTPITTVETKVISVTGFPGTEPSHTVVSDYGHRPGVILAANADSSSNVAFLNASGTGISILSLDVAGNLTGRIDPTVLQSATKLIGFTRIPADGSFAISYAKNNATNGADFEYWISRVSPAGATLFSTLVFGTQNKAQVGSKGEPGTFSSGRLVFNPATQRLIAYTGHTQRWEDNVRHQGGHVATMSLTGVLTVVNPWYCSHNFDQRLLVDGNNIYTLAHGDAYPRALVFGRWQDSIASTSFTGDTQYFAISGTIGNNTTNTQTGGMVKLANGSFGVVYTTKLTRNNFDVRFVEITPAGVAGTSTWLTSYPANTFAIYPRIARYGDAAAIFWEEVQGGTVRAVRTKLVGTAEANATAQGTVSDALVRLPAVYDIASLPNGGILWASNRGAGSLALQRVAAPAGSGSGVLRLENVVIGKSGANYTISGSINGGTPLAPVFLQASLDLGGVDVWHNIAVIPLNAAGQATFGPVTDPTGGALPKNFFRVTTGVP
ncbi:hypothetical protein OKA05_26565 [Luteolibacter arcticus]|uniref:Uncharacterized protein n=1 Tax=Luteolibacter arcticus TaxID=1581411 RepID=A0ABT3GRM8_9BACT|nr:hypothetical protein [Luteolibacter arcticus]MCW1926150.1 hypothetical protein [Luteolibacter arcticus]